MMGLIDEIIAGALKSDFFAGGMALGLLGIVAAYSRVWLTVLYHAVLRRSWSSLTLDNRSVAYRHFCMWMEQNNVLTKSRHIRLMDDRWASSTKGYAPAPGRHWFFYQGRLCRLDRSIDEKATIGTAENRYPMETFHVSILFGNIHTILGWIEAGRNIADSKDRIGPALHIQKYGYWENAGDIARRSMETVVVDDDRIQKVLDDLRWFYSARDWYAERGVPWRRGYLFYGPPGTGKSSLIRVLASELSLDIATLDVGRATLSDEDLREAMISVPRGSLIAIEDVDAVFTQRKGGEKQSGVSFSGLLNAIDGVAAQEGSALIMTTNHKDRLDPALIRPGRADVHVELGYVTGTAARRLFERFFPNETALGATFEARLGPQKYSPAAIQGWLLANSADPALAALATGLLSQRAGLTV